MGMRGEPQSVGGAGVGMYVWCGRTIPALKEKSRCVDVCVSVCLEGKAEISSFC